MVRAQVTRKLNNDKGFSLVELIIVVSILAIAAVPLMKSMGMAAKTNAKAQSIQNATSLGEHVMEEIKSSDIESLVIAHGGYDPDGKCKYTHSLKTVTQGEEFKVDVTINKETYSGNTDFDSSGSSTAKKANVGSANTLLLPHIEDIDTQSQAVLSKKELNKYDNEALSFFNEKLADYPSSHAEIYSKTIEIFKGNASGADDGVTVRASVTYEDQSYDTLGNLIYDCDADGNFIYDEYGNKVVPHNKYVRDLYTGTFIQQENSDDSKKYFNSNIFIFYTVGSLDGYGPIRETFIIKDESDTTAFEGYDSTKPTDSHKVYFVRQDKDDVDGPIAIYLNGDTDADEFDFSKFGELDDGRKEYDGIELITNLNGVLGGTKSLAGEGHIYSEKAGVRVYEVTVELSKGGEVYSTLNSTISATPKD